MRAPFSKLVFLLLLLGHSLAASQGEDWERRGGRHPGVTDSARQAFLERMHSKGIPFNDSTRVCEKCKEQFPLSYEYCPYDGMHLPPGDFMPYEKEPVIIKKVEPVYPELALRAGLEGTVTVKIWVGSDGIVRQAVVLKSSAEIFNEPAVAAAKRFLFSPAYLNNRPVAVWVVTTLKFKLTEKKKE